MSRETDARLERLLRQASKEGLWEPELLGMDAGPEAVTEELVDAAVRQAEKLTAKIFAATVLDAGESVGWGYEELLADAVDYELEVRELLRGQGDPLQLPPEVVARMLWRVELDPDDWRDLLAQFVASHVSFEQPVEGELWARAKQSARQGAASSTTARFRDPERASRIARAFVGEVVEEWESLATGQTTPEDSAD